jgi:hypothetical protein
MDDRPCLCIVDGICDLLGRELMTGPARFRRPLARRAVTRPKPVRKAARLGRELASPAWHETAAVFRLH